MLDDRPAFSGRWDALAGGKALCQQLSFCPSKGVLVFVLTIDPFRETKEVIGGLLSKVF